MPRCDGPVRLSIRLLGLEILTIEASTDEAEDDTARDLSGGTLAATPVGFTRWEQMREDDGRDYE